MFGAVMSDDEPATAISTESDAKAPSGAAESANNPAANIPETTMMISPRPARAFGIITLAS